MSAHSTPPVRPSGGDENDLDVTLLERYWLNEASPEDVAGVEAWLAAHPEWHARYSRLRHRLETDAKESWIPIPAEEVQVTIRSVFEAIGLSRHGQAVNTGESASTTMSQPPVRNVPLASFETERTVKRSARGMSTRRFVAISMSLAVLLVAGVTWFFGRTGLETSSEQSYTTGIGQRITITLSDGSRVTLAPQTVLRVPREFGASTRDVALRGEAHFDIVSQTALPFTVRTGATHTRVLGTRFVIKHYDNDQDVRVAVESGKVSVEGQRTLPAVLTAGRVASVTDTGVAVFSPPSMSEYTDWMNSQLTFRSTPLPDVLATLSRWYGVQFNIADSTISMSRITGELPYGPLEDMLKALQDMLDVSLSYARAEDGSLTVTLRPARSHIPPRLRRENRASFPTTFGR